MKAKLKKDLKLFAKISWRTNIFDDAAAVTYYVLLAMLPFFLFAGSLLKTSGVDVQVIYPYLKMIVPKELYRPIMHGLETILFQGSKGILIVTIIAAIWAISRGINTLKRSSARLYGFKQPANPILNRLIAIVISGALLLALFLIGVVFSFGAQFLKSITPLMSLNNGILVGFNFLKWPVTWLMMVLIIMILYYSLANREVPFHRYTVSAIIATFAVMALSQVFSYYIRYFLRTFNATGTVGAYMAVLFWLYFICLILLAGVIINVFQYEQSLNHD